jgi:hypothetical protein
MASRRWAAAQALAPADGAGGGYRPDQVVLASWIDAVGLGRQVECIGVVGHVPPIPIGLDRQRGSLPLSPVVFALGPRPNLGLHDA